MVKKYKHNSGIALIPALVLAMILTASVTTYFFMAKQAVESATQYSGNIAAKWAARSGVYIAEEIMRNSDCVGCYTNGGGVTVVAYPSYVSVSSSGGAQCYRANISEPLLNITPKSFEVRITAGANPRNATVTVQVPNFIAAHYYQIQTMYYKRYMTDFGYYIDGGEGYIDHIPATRDMGASNGIRINGFWDILTADTGATITTKGVQVSEYIRFLTTLNSGIDAAGQSFGQYVWSGGVTGVGTLNITNSSTGRSVAIGMGQHDIFRLVDPGTGKTYMDHDFDLADPDSAIYQAYLADLSCWNTWKNTYRSSLGNWFMDRSNGAQDFEYSLMPGGKKIDEIFATRSNRTFRADDLINYHTMDDPAVLKQKAKKISDKINEIYPGVARPRAIVNYSYTGGDWAEAAVEIDLRSLAQLTQPGDVIRILPKADDDSGNYSNIRCLSVVLTNGSDLSGLNDVTLYVEGAVYTHGNINTETTSGAQPYVTIAARDCQYVLSANIQLRSLYMGNDPDGTESGYEHYIPDALTNPILPPAYVAENLTIYDSTYANTIHSTTGCTNYEYPLTGWYIDNWNNNPSWHGQTVGGVTYDIDPAQGQFWRYSGTGTKEGVIASSTPNDKYDKAHIPCDTTIYASFINAQGPPMPIFEQWNYGPNPKPALNFHGSMIVVKPLEEITVDPIWGWETRISRLEWWQGHLRDSWTGRTGYATNPISYYLGATYSDATNRHENYIDGLMDHLNPFLFDEFTRLTWNETIR